MEEIKTIPPEPAMVPVCGYRRAEFSTTSRTSIDVATTTLALASRGKERGALFDLHVVATSGRCWRPAAAARLLHYIIEGKGNYNFVHQCFTLIWQELNGKNQCTKERNLIISIITATELLRARLSD
jgi:hypothetical protein